MEASTALSTRPYLWQFDPGRYRRAYLHGGVDEATVQRNVIACLANFALPMQIIEAGGAAFYGRFAGAMRRAGIFPDKIKKILQGVKDVAAAPPGHSDLAGVLGPNGRAVFLEVKRPAKYCPKTGKLLREAGKPTKEQLAFLDRNAAVGAIVGVVWSMDDALDVIGWEALDSHKQACKFHTKILL